MTMAENSLMKKLKSSGCSLVVFYSSQTGTVEEFGGRLAIKRMVAGPEEGDMSYFL